VINRKVIRVIIIIIFIIIGNLLYRRLSVHKPISSENIASMQLWGVYKQGPKISNEEKQKIVEAFNSIYSIRRNPEFQGTTPESGITIDLKSGEHISVIKSGRDFEIQRHGDGKAVSYWGKNRYIKTLLEELSRKE